MNGLLVAPIVLPIATAAALVLLRHTKASTRHAIGFASTLAFFAIALTLFLRAAEGSAG